MTHPTHHQPVNESRHRAQSEQRWSAFLNATLGVLGYSLGLTCLSSKTPSFNAFLSLVFLFCVWLTGKHLMPAHFRSDKETGHEGKGGGVRALKELAAFYAGTLPAVFGYVYLSAVMFSGPVCDYLNLVHQWPGCVHAIQGYVGAP